MYTFALFFPLFLVSLFLSVQGRPNVIVVLVDDMGYSDLGSFGGEVRTPHLDKLAANGLRFTQNYNSARCCPSRASLLTGQYSSNQDLLYRQNNCLYRLDHPAHQKDL